MVALYTEYGYVLFLARLVCEVTWGIRSMCGYGDGIRNLGEEFRTMKQACYEEYIKINLPFRLFLLNTFLHPSSHYISQQHRFHDKPNNNSSPL